MSEPSPTHRCVVICSVLPSLVEYSHFFQGHGWEVGVAESPDSALELFIATPPKLILFLPFNHNEWASIAKLGKSFTTSTIICQLAFESPGKWEKLVEKGKQFSTQALLPLNSSKSLLLEATEKGKKGSGSFFTVDPAKAKEDSIIAFKSKATIYLIDDSSTIQKIVKTIFQKTIGYENLKLRQFTNGQDFLNEVSMKPVPKPALVLVDRDLPEGPGIQLIQNSRKEGALQGVPCVMMSPQMNKVQLVKCLQSGIQDIIVKPFTPDILMKKINNTLTKTFAEVAA